jgi:beta-galactosidase/beta-glucuronidase
MPFTYKKEFFVPSDYNGKHVRLRMEGLFNYVRVWVNGIFICDHSGGFTAWECDITSAVNPGKTAVLMA